MLKCLQGIIRRVQEDGPGRGNVDLDILPRSVRNRLKDIIEDVSHAHTFQQLGRWGQFLCYARQLQCAEACQGPELHVCWCVQGRISKTDIDARMLKALADLPVDLGIEAIDKFAMASLDSIRSKTGFMVSLPASW